MADFRVRAGLWVCKWCRSKAERICDIEHEDWCQIFKDVAPEAAPGRQEG